MIDATPSPPPDKRRLAAVVFTDVVGYSARMQRNEGATIKDVAADFERMRTLCVENSGEALNSMGDGLMLCFPSAVHAVSFALKIQGEFAARKSSSPEALEHRIGVHLGDVISLENGGVAGDGVNIASRLEAKAPPGGICISQTVYDTVNGKVPMQADFIGSENFKNIAQPIPVWHVRLEGTTGASDAGRSRLAPKGPRRAAKRWLIPAVSAVLVLAIAAGGWLWLRRDVSSSRTGSGAVLTLADGKSIAVLPFTNMSGDKDNAYFADGMHEELLTQLALLRELKVVSRTSVMDYRDSKKNMRQIGTELGVNSLVEGSVRRAGNQVRVTAQLIDASSDKHLWAASYDRELKDIFAIQSELATEIARALKVSLSPNDQTRLAKKPTENLAAYDLFLRYQELVNRSKGTFRVFVEAKERIALLSQAVELDPRFALAWAKLGAEHAVLYGQGIDGTAPRLTQAKQAIERALALARDDIEVQVEEGKYYLYSSRDYGRAAQSFENVLRIVPNNVDAHLQLAAVRRREDRYAEYVVEMQKVLAIDPRNLGALSGFANFLWDFRYYDRALALQQKVIDIRPDDLDLQGKFQSIEFTKSGKWDTFDKWRSTLPPGIERTVGRIWVLDQNRAWARRDFEEVIRLMNEAPDDVQSAPSDKLGLSVGRALALIAKGERPRAMSEARAVLAQAAATLRDRPDDLDVWGYSYASRAILGEREAALAEHAKARKLAIATKEHYRTVRSIDNDLLFLRALLGDRDLALQDLSRQVKLPGNHAHYVRRDGAFFALWDDPRFLAIVNDPSNNAPVPFNFQYPPAATK